jgi:hypothetical protein
MCRALRLLRLIPIACAVALYAHAQPQQAPPESAPAPAGLETPWEMAPILEEIGAHATRMLPELAKIDVKSWEAKGASDTYAAQLQSAKDQAQAIAVEAKSLARNPERLSASIQLLFRIQGMDSMLNSLEAGLRTYQSPPLAQQLVSLAAENGANRGRLQTYVVNLAAQREQEFKVMDREAQRCRGILTTATPAARTPGRKK